MGMDWNDLNVKVSAIASVKNISSNILKLRKSDFDDESGSPSRKKKRSGSVNNNQDQENEANKNLLDNQKFFRTPSDQNFPDAAFTWRINFDKFKSNYIRTQISKAVRTKFDDRAADILEAVQILLFSKSSNTGSSSESSSMPETREFYLSELKRSESMKVRAKKWNFSKQDTEHLISRYLKLMQDDNLCLSKNKQNNGWIGKAIDGTSSFGDDQFIFCRYNIIQSLVYDYLVRITEQSCGADCVRILGLLFQKNYTDVTTLKKILMIEKGQLMVLLYTMLQKNIITIQAIPKNGRSCDYTYQQSHYIFGLDLEYSTRVILSNLQQCHAGLSKRLKAEYQKIEKLKSLKKSLEEIKMKNKDNENFDENDYIDLTAEQSNKLVRYEKIKNRICVHQGLMADDMIIFEEYLRLVPRVDRNPNDYGREMAVGIVN